MKPLLKILPWLFVALFGTEILAIFMPRKDGALHTREFARLPVLMNGRVQPFDSVARNTLLQIRSTGDLPLEEVPAWKFWHHPKKLKSTEWLLEVLFKPEVADTRPIFLIHHPDLLAELNLTDKGVEKSGLRYFTFDQLKPLLPEIDRQGNQARQVDDKSRTPLQKQVVKLENAVGLYVMMKAAIRPPGWDGFASEVVSFGQSIPAGIKALEAEQAGQPYDKGLLEKFSPVAFELVGLAKDPNAGQSYPLVVPPWNAQQKRDDWSSMAQALAASLREGQLPEPVKLLAAVDGAYSSGRADDFNQAVSRYQSWLSDNSFLGELAKGRHEFFYNDTKAFLHAMIIYICAFILAGFALLTAAAVPQFSDALRKSSFYLILLAFVVHTFGLVFRMYLEGRPPVTNLYSSAIFIGWGAVVLGSVLERIYRIGIGAIVASFAGFVTLLIAHNLAIGGDTMEMLRAVLDTNFWLATHVVVVTLGYASTFVAGLLAILYIFLGVFTPMLSQKLGAQPAPNPKSTNPKIHPSVNPIIHQSKNPPIQKPGNPLLLGKALSKMVYAILCFATLFSFTGTVLGGIWADQSWGRFWGWDPKENGALLIVLWNALILHARWGGLVRDRGIVNLAVFGNIVTSFSWFGVNMLGVGLHSYGFMDAAFYWLMLFIGSQLLIIGVGLLPLNLWRSFRSEAPVTPSLPAGARPAAETA